MTDREKLIEILKKANAKMKKIPGIFSQWGDFADVLIANGVTFAKDINVPSKWIPVTERLPKSMEWVLGFVSSGAMRVLRYDHIMDDWDTVSRNVCIRKEYVTHWMPLPEPPGNEE